VVYILKNSQNLRERLKLEEKQKLISLLMKPKQKKPVKGKPPIIAKNEAT